MRHTSSIGGWSTPMSLAERLNGDFDVALDFEIEKLTETGPGDSSLMAFQIEYPDKEFSRFHAVLFHDPNGISKLAVHHQRISSKSGKDEGTESHTVILKTLTGLRIVRKGIAISVIATSPEYAGEFVLAQFPQPQSFTTMPAKLNIFIHTGGPNGEISVMLKKLRISKSAVIEQ